MWQTHLYSRRVACHEHGQRMLTNMASFFVNTRRHCCTSVCYFCTLSFVCSQSRALLLALFLTLLILSFLLLSKFFLHPTLLSSFFYIYYFSFCFQLRRVECSKMKWMEEKLYNEYFHFISSSIIPGAEKQKTFRNLLPQSLSFKYGKR